MFCDLGSTQKSNFFGRYKILMHPDAYDKAMAYQGALALKEVAAGSYFQDQLGEDDLSKLGIAAFIELLMRTKRPQIFAESAVVGDGSDWSQAELSILGDISMAVPVTIFDDGRHAAPKVHVDPFGGTLLYVPGALLRNGRGKTPADWQEVTSQGEIDFEAYYRLYERRLLPGLLYANGVAGSMDKQAFITAPGLGCGQFAGKFKGQLGVKLRQVLIRLLENHGSSLPHIRAVYYDPYQECENERLEIEQITLFVRPLTQGNQGKSQLCRPAVYDEEGDDFNNCELFSFVAWDHVSWPGNDFYVGARATDEGVKAAATSSMAIITGVAGFYNVGSNTYDPPGAFRDWYEVVLEGGVQLQVRENLVVLPGLV